MNQIYSKNLRRLGVAIGATAGLLIILYPEPAHAQTTAHGTITAADFDTGSAPSVNAGRGICILMGTASPAFPNGTSGWACLAIANPLYREITAVLLAALYAQKTCDVFVVPPANSFWQNEIKTVICYPN